MPALFLGKVAIVTGGASGIGKACVSALARAGAVVFAADLDDARLATIASNTEEGVTTIRCDVTSDVDVRSLVSAAESAGGLDVAINCAGILQPPAAFGETGADVFHRTLRVNSWGVWLCMQHEISAMLPRGKGAIVNVASVAGLVGVPMMHAYTASKHAVVGMTRSVGYEMSGRGIRVNAVCPGATLTPMTEHMEQDASGQAGKRMAEAGEIANAILHLASDEASYIAGAAFAIDNGFTAV